MTTGLTLTVLAAICGGGLGLLLRVQCRYTWENTWMLSQLFTMVVLPLLVAQLFLPDWPSAILAVKPSMTAIIVALGFLWGIGSVAFAIGIDSVGLSLGYAWIMGIITAVGSVLPMVRKWELVPAPARLTILFGIVVCLLGVALYGKAGVLRERETKQTSPPAQKGARGREGLGVRALVIGLGWCFLSGILSACNNIGFDYADPIATQLVGRGVAPLLASLIRWFPLFLGGYLAVLVFSGSTMIKRRTWKNFITPGTEYDLVRAVSLGVLSFVAMALYGMGASALGLLGTTVGYAVFLALSIIVALVLGFMLGEWRAASRRSLNTLYSGLAALILAVVILALGNSLIA